MQLDGQPRPLADLERRAGVRDLLAEELLAASLDGLVDVANLSPLAEPLLTALEEMTVSACRAGGASCAAGAFAGWPLGSASGVDGRPGRPGGQAPPHLPPLRPLSVGYDVERRKLNAKDGSLDFTFHDSPAPTSTSIVV